MRASCGHSCKLNTYILSGTWQGLWKYKLMILRTRPEGWEGRCFTSQTANDCWNLAVVCLDRERAMVCKQETDDQESCIHECPQHIKMAEPPLRHSKPLQKRSWMLRIQLWCSFYGYDIFHHACTTSCKTPLQPNSKTPRRQNSFPNRGLARFKIIDPW